MSTGTNIEWTDDSWNTVAGCTRASAGCDNCYAAKMTHRLEAMGQAKYTGLTVLNPRGERHFNGVVRTVPEALPIPLSWRKPRRVFVNSMSDLFHKDVPSEFIDQVFAIMARCPQHTFQVLTKRAERMAKYLTSWPNGMGRAHHVALHIGDGKGPTPLWPLPNVWIGTSCENQDTANERIPHLLRCPAAVRFLSCEPLLGPIHLNSGVYSMLAGVERGTRISDGQIHWVIVGGESGGRARECDIDWVRGIVQQCQASQTACFVKQMGSRPCRTVSRGTAMLRRWKNSKGGDPAEWPEDLRVRQFPAPTT